MVAVAVVVAAALAVLVAAELELVLVHKQAILAHQAVEAAAVADPAPTAVSLDSMLVEMVDLVQLYWQYLLPVIQVRHPGQL
jgi:methylthioribose-1-phosphate isomerase